MTSPVFINAGLNIIGDITLFVSGDSNGDGAVDLSDPVFTLEFLFLGGRPSYCMDAADADDDGVVDITDPVATLAFLFLDGREPPAPFRLPGLDPTGDGLPCQAGS